MTAENEIAGKDAALMVRSGGATGLVLGRWGVSFGDDAAIQANIRSGVLVCSWVHRALGSPLLP